MEGGRGGTNSTWCPLCASGGGAWPTVQRHLFFHSSIQQLPIKPLTYSY